MVTCGSATLPDDAPASSTLPEERRLIGRGDSIRRRNSIANTMRKSGDRRVKSLKAVVASLLAAWREERKRGGRRGKRGGKR